MLLRLLSKADFGVWALFLTVTAFIEVSRNALVQAALIKYITSAVEEEYRKILAASFFINGMLTFLNVFLLFVLGLFLSNLWDAPSLQPMLWLYICTNILLVPFSQCTFLQQANFDFQGIFWSNVVRQASLFAYIAYAFFTSYQLDLYGLVLVHLIGAAFGSVVAVFFSKNYWRLSLYIDWQWVSRLFHFGKYAFGSNLSVMLYKNIDRIMLGTLLSTASVAIYDLAIRINNLMEIPIAAAAAIVFPKSAKENATKGNAGVKLLYEQSVGGILALIVPAVIMVQLFPETIITILAGEEYLDTVEVLRFTVLIPLYIAFARQSGITFDSIGKPAVNLALALVGIVCNIILNYVLVKLIGVIGAAIGTLITLTVVFTLYQYLLYINIGAKPQNALKYIVPFYGKAYEVVKGRLFK